MVRHIRCSAVLLLVVATQFCLAKEPGTFDKLKSNGGLGKKVYKLASQIWEGINYVIDKTSDVPESDGPAYRPPGNSIERDVTDSLRYLSTRTDDFKIDVLNMQNGIIDKVLEQVPAIIQLNQRFSKIFVNTVHVNEKYEKFLNYYRRPGKYDESIIRAFANTVLNGNNGVKSLIERTHSLLLLGDISSFSTVQLLSDNMELFLQYAKVARTPQQFLYDIFQSTLFNEVKGYLVMRYSYKMLRTAEDWDYDDKIEVMEREFGQRINRTLDTFSAAMSGASRELMRFNPSEHKEDVTYTELKRVFQEFIVNEYDVKPSDGCKKTCSNYRIPDGKALNGCFYADEVCSVKTCDGYLYDCRKKVDTTMNVCISPMFSDRNYEFVDFANGAGHYGHATGKCWADTIKTAASHVSIPWSCDSCMCVCADTSSQSQRFFNLNPSMATIAENYVVTGARFVKKNRVVHIQIQEGQLLPNGMINSSTTRWAPINENPTNYHTLAWENGREVNLDDLHAPKKSVLTGLAFSTESTSNFQRRLHLKIFSAPVSYETGRLWINDQKEKVNEPAKDEITLKDVDIPTRTSVVTADRSKPDSFVKFGPTGLEQDVGQSTIPFIDLQEVSSSPQIPMSGAGIYLKRRSNNGGFLTLKLFSYDHTQHMDSDSEHDN
ncbi:uncharacterized protein LOC100122910 [Nasonia vitripennis]|uniref:Uncharacterized protein n=1 Tax=Nasonia vitripennis TaxID=7425 RepID=A0A7M7IU47_NASVI|nr:uncharacterized protein LOC100122910 [Nasonia vitripennis]